MSERFLCCFRQKTSASLMVFLCMFFGSIGAISFGLRITLRPHNYLNDGDSKFDVHFFVISIFCYLTSLILMFGIIWEKPLLILTFEFSHFAVLVSFVVFITIYMVERHHQWKSMIFIGLFILFKLYWMCNIHMFYRQIRLKMISTKEYIDGDVYSVCNRLYENKYTHFYLAFFL